MQRPRPGERAKPDLEHARPVDAEEWWVRQQPALEILDNRAREARVARQPRGSSGQRPVLMAVVFPGSLVSADRIVQIRAIRVEDARGPPAMPRIAVPVHAAIRARISHTAVTQEAVAPFENPIGARALVCRRRG